MNTKDRSRLKELALKDITENFKIIKEKSNNEKIYGFGLGLVEDLTGFFTVANTIESFKRNFENEKHYKSYLWSISEWKYSGNYNDNDSIYKLLSEITSDFGIFDEKYDEVRKEYEQVLIECLTECRRNGIFDEQTVLYLQYADCFNEDIDNLSSEVINSEKLHKQFINRWKENKEDNLSEIIMNKVRNIE